MATILPGIKQNIIDKFNQFNGTRFTIIIVVGSYIPHPTTAPESALLVMWTFNAGEWKRCCGMLAKMPLISDN